MPSDDVIEKLEKDGDSFAYSDLLILGAVVLGVIIFILITYRNAASKKK